MFLDYIGIFQNRKNDTNTSYKFKTFTHYYPFNLKNKHTDLKINLKLTLISKYLFYTLNRPMYNSGVNMVFKKGKGVKKKNLAKCKRQTGKTPYPFAIFYIIKCLTIMKI